MPWTKVTDALPHEGERLMATIVDNYGIKRVLANVKRNNNHWLVLGVPLTGNWLYIKSEYITHWAPMPAPAGDE